MIALVCTKCGANLQVENDAKTYVCSYCRTPHQLQPVSGTATPGSMRILAQKAMANGEFGKAMQFVEQGLSIDPADPELLALEAASRTALSQLAGAHSAQVVADSREIANRGEAEQYRLQAQFILAQLQANKQVYGSNSAITGATPADVDLALQYVGRSLEHFPESAVYLNLKALLLWEGLGDKAGATALLEKAAAIDPRDINIQNNLKTIKASACFIATAAFGTPFSSEVRTLREWRDQRLMKYLVGRWVVRTYYFVSPPIAAFISNRSILRAIVRAALGPLARLVGP